jgi:hypothetical protein
MAFSSSFAPPAFERRISVESRAINAIDAVIEAGATTLVAEPWRADRIVRGAERLTLDELAKEAARRRALPPPADFNRVLALAQLSRALEKSAFARSWGAQRLRLRKT